MRHTPGYLKTVERDGHKRCTVAKRESPYKIRDERKMSIFSTEYEVEEVRLEIKIGLVFLCSSLSRDCF